MSIIVKLGIQGIRSFGELDLECISFDWPVTLIVGANGSGKTTVIECLKMASSGILPPNSNGGKCFIHDPLYASAPEVKGQIRMLFRQSTGSEILAIRSFQLTRSRTPQGVSKLTYKAVESVIKTGTGDERHSLSQRCADMDVKVPHMMGVSRAILENVIFCHQEDCNWPLQEQGVLKKKFDAIFGATRYTMALKNIAFIKATKTVQQKEKKAAADVLAVHLQQAKTLRSRKDAVKATEEEQKKKLAEVEQKIVAAEQRKAEAEDRRNRLAQMAIDLASTKEAEHLCRQQRAAIRVPQALDGNLRQLDNALRENESKQSETERTRQRDMAQELETARQLESVSREREEARQKVNALADVPESIAKHTKKQQDLWREFGMLQGEYLGRNSLGDVMTYVRREQQSLTHCQRKNEEEEQSVKRRIAEVDEKARKAKAQYDQAAAKCEELQRSVLRVTSELSQFDDVEQQLVGIQSEIRAITAQGGDNALHTLEGQLNDLDREKNDLQFNIQRKQENVRQLEMQSKQLGQVDLLKTQAQEADNLVAEHRNKAPTADIPVDTSNLTGIRQRVDDWLAGQQSTLDKKRADMQTARNTLSNWEAKLKCTLDTEKQLQCQIEYKEREVGKITVPEAERQLAEAEEILEEAATRENYGHASVDLLAGLLRASKKKCELCTRVFNSPEEKQVMADHAAEIGAKASANYEDAEAAKTDAEQSVAQKRATLTTVQAMHQLVEQLKTEASTRDSIERSRQDAKRALGVASQDVETMVNLVAVGETWRVFATELERLEMQALSVHRAAKDKASLLVAPPQGGSGSLTEERAALSRYVEEREAVLRKQDSMRNDQRLLVQQKHSQELQLMERQKEEALINMKVERKRALTLEQGRSRQEWETANAPLASLKTSMEDAAKMYTQTTGQCEARLAELNERFAKQQRKVLAAENFQSKITELQDEVDVYEQRQKSAEAELTALTKLNKAVDGCTAKLNFHKKNVQDGMNSSMMLTSEHQNLEKNIEVRRIDVQLAEYGRKRQQLEEAGVVDSRGLQETVDNAIREVTELKIAAGKCTEAIDIAQREVASVSTQLNSTMYDNIEEVHRLAVLDSELTLIVIQDLGKYHAALDRALMKFHASKMTDINKLVRDMWRQVYRGNDIGYIQIRSDADDEKTPGQVSGAGSRSHNYRVVMIDVYTNTELDMRGRCSAGQKVLASLIIRLALADAFGCQCGVFTLDEPTTNLDSRNIEALAEALAELIRLRSVNDSFQLMIITHDETFVGMLARHQVCDRYWRVSKDEKGHSKISSDDIRRLMG